ncbi:MAG: response regulator [Caldisericia bacterium]|jgi:CheY-like chemotaxis protein|nr:response regulator [Caldisericia bacterium]MDD3428148.1 response regulator [Caldisericia bacterium]MDD5689557.1 response regulator [Caldisericia bacterium]HOJ16576.1 response regulator [Caldisericia bacterium]HOW02736.1 response regulator [Caldisericia bacterium]
MSKKVLVIDDDKDVVEAMRIALEANNYEVEVASSGREGLEKVKTFKPDLILLDIMMDTITDGLHVSYAIKDGSDPEYKEFANVPIIMISSIESKQGISIDKVSDSDFIKAEYFLRKPVNPDTLIQKVKEVLHEN